MNIFDEPKIDCHAHVIDPAHFPYGKGVAYKPVGQEVGTTAQFVEVMKCHGVKHALLVQPNSGYGSDNSCMLDAIAKGDGRFKGIAIVDLDSRNCGRVASSVSRSIRHSMAMTITDTPMV